MAPGLEMQSAAALPAQGWGMGRSRLTFWMYSLVRSTAHSTNYRACGNGQHAGIGCRTVYFRCTDPVHLPRTRKRHGLSVRFALQHGHCKGCCKAVASPSCVYHVEHGKGLLPNDIAIDVCRVGIGGGGWLSEEGIDG